jgi:hypothetical protein
MAAKNPAARKMRAYGSVCIPTEFQALCCWNNRNRDDIMGKPLTLATLATLVALPLIAGATNASASCEGRKDTGTLVGGVGGALLGNSISHGGGGAIIGGLGGAVIGHQIAKQGCGPSHSYYRRSHSRYARDSAYSRGSTYRPAPQAYYDQRGNLVSPRDDYRR